MKAKKIKPKLPVQVDETKAFLSKHFQYSEFAIPAKKLAYIVDAMGSNAIKQFLINPERLVGISNDPDGFREKILEKLNKITGEQQALQAFEEVGYLKLPLNLYLKTLNTRLLRFYRKIRIHF